MATEQTERQPNGLWVATEEAATSYKQLLSDLGAERNFIIQVATADIASEMRLPTIISAANWYEGEESVSRFLVSRYENQFKNLSPMER